MRVSTSEIHPFFEQTCTQLTRGALLAPSSENLDLYTNQTTKKAIRDLGIPGISGIFLATTDSMIVSCLSGAGREVICELHPVPNPEAIE